MFFIVAIVDAARDPSADTVTGAVDDDDRPPICPRCGVTMVPAALSAEETREAGWACIECEELGEEQ